MPSTKEIDDRMFEKLVHKCMSCCLCGSPQIRTISIKASQLVSSSLQFAGHQYSDRGGASWTESPKSQNKAYKDLIDLNVAPRVESESLVRAAVRPLESRANLSAQGIADQRIHLEQALQAQIASEHELTRYFVSQLHLKRYRQIMDDWQSWRSSMKLGSRSARLQSVRTSVFIAFMCLNMDNIPVDEINSQVKLIFRPMKPPKNTGELSHTLKELKFSAGMSRKILDVARSVELDELMPDSLRFLAGIDNLFSKYRSTETWNLYQQAKDHPTPLDSAVYHKFALGFLGIDKAPLARTVINDMREAAIKIEPSLWNALIASAGKQKDLVKLRRIWSEMKADNVPVDTVMSTTLLHGYFSCGAPDLALEVLHDMIKDKSRPPNTITCNVVVKGLIRFQGPEAALDFLINATSTGMNADSTSYNLLLKAFLATGDTVRVQFIDSRMKLAGLRDVASYTILLDHMMKKESGGPSVREKVRAVLLQMENDGIKGNAHLYSTIIKSTLYPSQDTAIDLVPTLEQLGAAEAWLIDMKKNSIPRTIVIYEMLIRGHVLRGVDVRPIFQIWDEMRRDRIVPDSGAYNIMIKGLAQNNMLPEAYSFFEKSLISGHLPRPNTLSYLLNAAAAQNQPDIASLVLRYMAQSNFSVTTDGLKRALERVELIGCDTSSCNITH